MLLSVNYVRVVYVTYLSQKVWCESYSSYDSNALLLLNQNSNTKAKSQLILLYEQESEQEEHLRTSQSVNLNFFFSVFIVFIVFIIFFHRSSIIDGPVFRSVLSLRLTHTHKRVNFQHILYRSEFKIAILS